MATLCEPDTHRGYCPRTVSEHTQRDLSGAHRGDGVAGRGRDAALLHRGGRSQTRGQDAAAARRRPGGRCERRAFEERGVVAAVEPGVARGRSRRWTQWLLLSMVRAGKPARVAGRVVVESAVSSARHARAAVLHRVLPHGESTLAAELYRREQGISSDP